MLLVFHSKAAADVLMLSQHAIPILCAAGKIKDQVVPERGVWTTAQLPDAIAAIERATREEDASIDRGECDDERVAAMDQVVSLRVRAYPLLDMLRRAQQKGVDVLWEPA